MKIPLGLAPMILLLTAVVFAQDGVWTQQSPAGTPLLRSQSGFSHDAGTGQQLLFGGLTLAGALSDATYRYDGTSTWTLLPQATRPSARKTSMVFDSSRSVHVLYGGDTGGLTGAADTWEFDGTSWNNIATSSNPGPRVESALSFDPVQLRTLLFSGVGTTSIYAADTWAYDGATASWTMVPTSQQPGGRRGHRLIYDSLRGVHVLFGGESHLNFKYNDTWEFDAALGSWSQVTTANSPPARHLHAMAYDAARGVTIVYGGADANGVALGDTWEYDGSNWTQVAPLGSPAGRIGARFASDAAGGSAILYGGSPSTTATNATWRYATTDAPIYPGTGGDCAIEVSVFGVVSGEGSGLHPLLPTDFFALRLYSPLGTLDNQTLALIYTLYPQGSPPTGLSLLGAGPADVWVNPNSAVVVINSLGPPTSVFVPLLFPTGLNVGPFNVPPGLTGQAANLQIFVTDPGGNPVNLATSDTAILEFN